MIAIHYDFPTNRSASQETGRRSLSLKQTVVDNVSPHIRFVKESDLPLELSTPIDTLPRSHNGPGDMVLT